MDALETRCSKKRAFIVSDEFNAKNAEKAARFLKSGSFTTEIWAKTLPEAPMENVIDAAEALKTFEADLIMAVGGGSVMDLSKGAWVLYERPDMAGKPVLPKVKLNLRQKAKFLSVPTTSGTGADVTWVAVLTDRAKHQKMIFAHAATFPLMNKVSAHVAF